MATSYANNAGTGERRPEIVVLTDTTSSSLDISGGFAFTSDDVGVFVDGVTSGGPGIGTAGRELGTSNNGNDRHFTFDFGVGASIVIDEIKLYLTGTTDFGSWTIEGSNDNSSWTTLKSAFTLQASAGSQTCSFTNSTGYRYYRFHTTSFQNGGATSGTWNEFEFKLEDTTPQASRTSWFNTGGKGARATFITATTDLSLSSGVIANVIDGNYTNDSSHAIALNSGGTTKNITFDFGAGISVVVDTFAIWTAASPGNSDGSWKAQGSNDGSGWTDLDTTAVLFDTSNAYTLTKRTVANTTGYRYYRLLQTSGSTSTSPVITEIEFRISGYTAVRAKDYKLSGYGIIAPANARAFKASGYAILKPVSVGSKLPVLVIIAS